MVTDYKHDERESQHSISPQWLWDSVEDNVVAGACFLYPLCQNQEIINTVSQFLLPFCTMTHFCCGANLGNGRWREMPACSRRPTGWQPERFLGFISCQIPHDSWWSQWSLIHLFFIYSVLCFLWHQWFLLAGVGFFFFFWCKGNSVTYWSRKCCNKSKKHQQDWEH